MFRLPSLRYRRHQKLLTSEGAVPCSTSEWCKKMEQTCLEANDLKGVKAYSELYSLWKKREMESAKTSCVCGKSESDKCTGKCALGE